MSTCQQLQFDPCTIAIDVDSDPVLSNSEFSSLLDLVIPGDDLPLTPTSKEQTTAPSSSEQFSTLLDLVIPGNDVPVTPIQKKRPINSPSNSEQFSALLDLVIPGEDAPVTPVQKKRRTNVPSSNEFLALLDLVIPNNDAPPASLEMEMEQISSYEDPLLCFTCRISVPPRLPPQQLVGGFDFGDFPAQTLASPCWGSSPSLTSFRSPEPAFDVPNSPTKPAFGRPCALVTPLELFQVLLKPVTEDVKWSPKPLLEDVKRSPKASDKCTVPGCNTKKQSRGRCMRHGGGRRCIAFGCTNGAQTKGLCKRHGGGARCRVPNCSKSSQSGGLCRTHGGGKLCIAPGCKKGAQRHGKCAMHSSRKCSIDGCSSVERCGGFCGRHKHLKRELEPLQPSQSLEICVY